MGLTPSIPLSTLVREGDVLTPLSSLAGEGVGGWGKHGALPYLKVKEHWVAQIGRGKPRPSRSPQVMSR